MARPAIIAASSIVAACGLSHSPRTPSVSSFPFELSVREVRTETIYRAADDSMAAGRFVTSLGYFGRIEPPLGEDPAILTVHTDSLVYASEVPFRFTAHILRDTIEVTTGREGIATPTGALDSDEEMLACLFNGPALRISLSSERERDSAGIEDLKSECEGGLYRRLNLAVTLGAFVFGAPAGENHDGDTWQTTEARPSFSGLGHFPQLRWLFKISGVREKADTPDENVEIACDTTLTHVRAVMPNGETVDIIADRIRVRGSVRQWRDAPSFHLGTIKIEESIRYVRPSIAPSVLNKECSVEITLMQR